MAVSRIERLILKTMVYGSLVFDPEALDSDVTTDEPASLVRKRFEQLSPERKQPFHDYFKKYSASFFQVYRKSDTSGFRRRDYKIHYAYDRPDMKTEARRLVLAGFDLRRLNGEYFTFSQLHELRRAYEKGVEITDLLDNRFSRFQLKVLASARHRGFDISEFLDPSIPARDMMSAYYEAYESQLLSRMALEGQMKERSALDSLEPERLVQKKQSLQQVLNHAEDRRQSAKDAKVIDFASAAKKKQADKTL